MCTLHANLCTFIIIPPWILFRMKIISEELFKETQNKKFLGSIHCFTPKKILHLWENVEIYGRVQLKCDGTRWHREGKWRGNWWIECVASTLHTTSEHGVFSIIIANEPTSAASSRLNWRTPGRFKWNRPFRRKTKSWFLRVCHHISTGLYSITLRYRMWTTGFTFLAGHGVILNTATRRTPEPT